MTNFLSRQEIFNRVWKHLLTQNSKAHKFDDPSQSPVYLAPSGKRCAVGCLIAPEFDDEILNSTNLAGRYGFILETSGIHPADQRFAEEFMSIHDSPHVEDWENMLKLCAERYQLVVPPPPTT